MNGKRCFGLCHACERNWLTIASLCLLAPLTPRSIQEGLKQAKKAGDDKKLGMVASRK